MKDSLVQEYLESSLFYYSQQKWHLIDRDGLKSDFLKCEKKPLKCQITFVSLFKKGTDGIIVL